MALRRFYASVYVNNFPSLVHLSLLLLVMPTRVYLFFPPRDRKPLPTLRGRLKYIIYTVYINVYIFTPASNTVAFQFPAMLNVWTSICKQSIHFFSFLLRPLRNLPSRFPNMIRFVWQPPPTYSDEQPRPQKGLLVRTLVSMISRPLIPRARLYEVIRWFGLLRCAPMM